MAGTIGNIFLNENKFHFSEERNCRVFLPSNIAGMHTSCSKSGLQCDVRRVYTLVVQCLCH